jgi:hypothetical protein
VVSVTRDEVRISNYSTHKVFLVFASRCLIAASNGGRSPLSGFPNRLSYPLLTSHNCKSQLTQQLRKSKSKLSYDRRSVGQSVLVSSIHLGPKNRFLFAVRQLRVCLCGAPSLTIGRVCRLQLLLVLASTVILGSESRANDDILLSQFRDSPNLEGQVPVFIFLSDRVAQLYPQDLGSIFVVSYDSQGYGGGIPTRLHTGMAMTRSQSYFTTGGLPLISSSWQQTP